MEEILTVTEAARYLDKTPGTVRHWIASGILRARKISAGGTGVYVLLKTDVLEWMVARSTIPQSARVPKPKPSPQLEMKI